MASINQGIMTQGQNFLYIQPCRTDGCVSRPCMVKCANVGDLTDGGLTFERIKCRDPRNPNRQITVGRKRVFPEDGSGTIEVYATPGEKSYLQQLKDSGCPVRIMVVTILCGTGDQFTKWVEVVVAENATLGSISRSAVVNRTEDNEITYTIDFTHDPNLTMFWEPVFTESVSPAVGKIIDFAICEHGVGCPGDSCYEKSCGSIYAVTDAGELIHSTDSGKSYKLIPAPIGAGWPGAGINSVNCCGSGKDAVVTVTAMGGGQNVITATTADNGITWNITVLPQFDPINTDTRRAFQLGGKIFYGGINGNIALSTDCGQTSELVHDGKWSSAEVVSIFRCGSAYYSVHVDGTVLKSTDGGLNWSLVSVGEFPAAVTTAYCPGGCDGDCIWIGLADGSLRYSKDGIEWTSPPQWAPKGAPICAMTWCDRFTGAVAVGATVWLTIDGGYYWKCLATACGKITCLQFCDQNKLFVSMENGKMGMFSPVIENCEEDDCHTKGY